MAEGGGSDVSSGLLSLRQRLQLCMSMLALESYVSFEEIFMVSVLQRVGVPVSLVSLPGAIACFIGIFDVPLLGWVSDRLTLCASCGQRRPYACLTLLLLVIGMSVLIAVTSLSLYKDPAPLPSNLTLKASHPDVLPALAASWTPPSGWNASEPVSLRHVYEDLVLSVTNLTDGDALPLFPEASSVMSWTNASFSPSPGAEAAADPTESTSSSTAAVYIPLLGIIGIVGFIVADHGYDTSMATFKTYMVEVSPPSQHDNLFVLGTLAGAVGGCVTSGLGFIDLSVLIPQGGGGCGAVLDTGIAQCLVQSAFLLALVLVLGIGTLLTGSEKVRCGEAADVQLIAGKDLPSPALNADSPVRYEQLPTTADDGDAPAREDERARLLSSDARKGCLGWWRRVSKWVSLCAMTFLGLCANYSYFVFITNYVAEVIYQGDPLGATDSAGYQNYTEGVRMASLGMLTFYCLYVVFSLMHDRILKLIGTRMEFVGASLCCCTMMGILVLTDNIYVFFANAVTMAAFRSAVYTIPFMLSNNYAQQEYQEAKERKTTMTKETGMTMAAITTMIPASYFLVSLLMGSLIDITGYAGTPIVFALGTALLGVLVSGFVHFQ